MITKLSTRLQAIYDYVPAGSVVADIGCDHAQLCCALVDHHVCDQVYACDVNENPLLQAKKNIKLAKRSECITTVLSNGLENVGEDVDTIVIAGMGFETIQMILEAYPAKVIGRRFIIQSNKGVDDLRRWISKHRFNIIEERVIFEDSHYYQIVVFDTNEDEVFNANEILFGRKMIKDNTFYSLWKFRLSKLEKILSQMDENHPKYDEIFNEMKMIYQEFGS